jgi:probable HAF family extracellular repeat protein
VISGKQLSIATIGTVALGLGSLTPVSAASLYEVVGLDFTPTDINNSSQVVGANYLWEDGNVTDLSTLPGADNSDLRAVAINDSGTIVGNNGDEGPSTTSFISNGTTISALATDFGCEEACSAFNSTIADINNSGAIAVNYYGSTEQYSATLDSNGTSYQVLGIIFDINNQGQVVSTISSGRSGTNGIFSDGQGDSLTGTFLVPAASAFGPVPSQPFARSRAYDLDDNGNIVGASLVIPSSSLENTLQQATLWSDPTQPGVSLGTLGGEESEALGINNSMQVVGSSFLEDESTEHAFLWEDDELIDLNSLIDPASGWELTSAFEINDGGDIIGIGTYNGVQRGFVAKAVPEPSSVLGILGLGVFGLGRWLKRKQLSR